MEEKKGNCSLYIHIPFCVRKCLYCDFLSMAAGAAVREQYIQALLRELEAWKGILEGYRLHTVFVGGGTPTCLSPREMEQFTRGLLRILSSLDREEGMEFTLEANPGTVTAEHLSLFRAAGVNRVSLGLQSAQNDELEALGRIHSYEDFLKTYHLLREYGFSNLNIDLMSDIPRQSLASYEDTLEKVISLKPEHISAYSLIVEEGTPFYDMEERGVLEIPSEEVDRQMYRRTEEMLGGAGYRRYEISNYGRPGCECRHNLTYWNTGEYLGVGLGASSCLGGFRFQNTGDFGEYMSYFGGKRNFGKSMEDILEREYDSGKSMQDILEREYDSGKSMEDIAEKKKGAASLDQPPFQEMQRLTVTARKEEFMFLGLRKMEGVSAAEFQRRFGESLWDVYGRVIPSLIRQKLMEKSPDGERIFLTGRGIDVSNVVLAEFLLSD